MIDSTTLSYLLIASIVILPCLCVALGQRKIASNALEAMNTQPAARNEVTNFLVLSMALTETAAIIGLITSILLLFELPTITWTPYTSLGYLAIACAVGIPTGITGVISYVPAKNAFAALARQPFFSQKIFNLLLLSLSLLQTASLFGFILTILIKSHLTNIATLPEGLHLLACGIALGFGSIGPLIGIAHFAAAAIASIGINRSIYNRMLTFTFVSEGIIETPLLFALIISILIILDPLPTINPEFRVLVLLASASCIGLGTLVPSIMSGHVAAHATRAITIRQDLTQITSASLFSQIFLDTFAIYNFIIALLLLFLTH